MELATTPCPFRCQDHREGDALGSACGEPTEDQESPRHRGTSRSGRSAGGSWSKSMGCKVELGLQKAILIEMLPATLMEGVMARLVKRLILNYVET